MKCQRCKKYEAVYHVSDGYGGLERACVNCLTPDEKEAIEITRNHQDVCGVDGCEADGFIIDYQAGHWICERHAGDRHECGSGLR